VGIRKHWPLVRRVWITAGVTVTAVVVVWSLIAYRADSEAKAATATDDAVAVTHAEGIWRFTPATRSKSSTLVFFPGALVDPRAYAPLARSVAEAGYRVLLVELPRRGAFGGAESPELRLRTAAALASIPDHHSVVVGGHSKGAVVASTLSSREPGPAGVVLIGTSHPRDVDLSRLDVPVTKIVGTRDGVASPEKVEQNAGLLPAQTRWVWVEGGNHSQFGWYGFQPMDRRAEISAADQRRIMTQAVLELLQSVDLAASAIAGRADTQVPQLPEGARTHWAIEGPEEIVSWVLFDPAAVEHLLPARLRFITVEELAAAGIGWAADHLSKRPSRAQWGVSFLEIARMDSFTIDGDAPVWPPDGAIGLWFARVAPAHDSIDLGAGQPYLALEFWLPDSSYVATIREKGHHATYGNVVLSRSEDGKWRGTITMDGLSVVGECAPTGPITGGGSAGMQSIFPPASSLTRVVRIVFAGHRIQGCSEDSPWIVRGTHPLAAGEVIGPAEFQFGYRLVGGAYATRGDQVEDLTRDKTVR